MISQEQLAEFNDKIKNIKDPDELIGKNGLITSLFKDALQGAVNAELTDHLGYPKGEGSRIQKSTANKRNGTRSKKIRSSSGDMNLELPRDRNGTFESEVLEKYQSNTGEFDRKIISMYGRGMTTRDINEFLDEQYGVSVSDPVISSITDKILPQIEEWKNRPLDDVYPLVFLDAIHFKVKDNGKVVSKAVYLVIGIGVNGIADILGIWIGDAESSKFWIKVLTDLKNRGLEDILILCCDNLSGISGAIEAIYPKTIIQKCIIHQIRNSMKYITNNDRDSFMYDLKTVYKANTREEAESNLDNLEEKWDKQYGIVIKSWRDNWAELSSYFDYSPEIRKIIYTTNRIENVNRQIRKVTKNRSVFPTDTSLNKLVFLAVENMTKKWNMPIPLWPQIIAQFSIQFPERIKLDL